MRCPHNGCGAELAPGKRNACVEGHMWWMPNPGPQTRFLSLTCFEALYGGAAGGGKSASLLVDAIRHLNKGYGSNYHAILFRRTYPELEKSLIKESWSLYPIANGEYNENKSLWTFPGGERVEFAHIQHEKDIYKYQGAAFQYVGFDELTSFLESQYLYLISRVRSAHGVPCRIRAATNPGNIGHDWVFKRWGAWLDPKFVIEGRPRRKLAATGQFIPPVPAGEILYVKRRAGTGDELVEDVVPKGTEGAKARTFIPAKLADNPHLAADGEYEATLNALDPVTRAQLKDGDWIVKPAKGLYFKRQWFEILDVAPIPIAKVRYWDRASTKKTQGDWTVGARVGLDRRSFFSVDDVVRRKLDPGDVKALIVQTAKLDGLGVTQVLEVDPGSAGRFEASEYAKALRGYNVQFVKPWGDKITRAGPASAQAKAGNIKLVKARGADWHPEFLAVLEEFPEGLHDDDVDALSGAVAVLSGSIEAHDGTEYGVTTHDFDEAEIG